MVFSYSPVVPHDQIVLMDRSQFSDGRHRVIAHPSNREKIEQALRTWDERNV